MTRGFASLVLLGASTCVLQGQSGLETQSEVRLRAAFSATIVLRDGAQQGERAFAIDSAELVAIQVATNAESTVIELEDPAGGRHPSGVTDGVVSEALVRGALDGSSPGRLHSFVLTNPPGGIWTLHASEPAPFGGARVAVLTMESSSSLVMGLLGAGRDYPIGRTANPALVLVDSNGPVLSDSVTEIAAKLSAEDGSLQDVAFLDDGAAPDQAANDGIYSANLTLDTAGEYGLVASVSGMRGGEPFNRTTAERFRVTDPCVVFDGELAASVVQPDADGPLEGIAIELPTRVTRDSRIHALVLLEAANGLTTSVSSESELAAGSHTLEVAIPARVLRTLAVDGPYQIKQVSLSCLTDDGAQLSDIAYAVGETPGFLLSDTQGSAAAKVADFRETAVDENANGLFDRLDVEIDLAMLPAGEYDWRVALADPAGRHVAAAAGEGTLGAVATAQVSFAGTAIGSHAADGPYRVLGIELFGPEGSQVLTGVGSTRAYRYDQFEGAPTRPAGPLVNAGGVVDAASFQAVVSRGGIGSIFGSDFAPELGLATDVPLPRTLLGIQVLVDGRAAPLFFVSPTQINFQVPFETQIGAAVEIVVTRDGLASPAVTVRVADFAPAVFLNPGTGEPIVQRHPDLSLITADNPAKPGDVLIVFLTGVGGVANAPASGQAAGVPLSAATVTPTVTVGGAPAQVFYAGLAPFFVGLGQVNIQLAQTAALGKSQSAGAAPLVIDFGGAMSIPVNLPLEGAPPPPPSGDDLGVEMVEVLPEQALATDAILVRYAITNSGISGAAERDLYLSTDSVIEPAEDTLINTRPVTLYGEDQVIRSSSNNLPSGVALGSYFVGVVLRHEEDTNPANNTSTGLPIEIVAERPPFDLAVELNAISRTSVGQGDPIDITYTASGDNRLTGRFRRTHYLSQDNVITNADRELSSVTFTMSDGESRITSSNVIIPRDTELGGYFIGVIVSAEGDTDLSNNVSEAFPLRVLRDRRPFDLGIRLEQVSSTTLPVGGSFDVVYEILNPDGIHGEYERKVVLSRNAAITETAILVDSRTLIVRGGSGEVSSRDNVVPQSVPVGDYFLGMIIETGTDTNLVNNFSQGIPVTVVPGAVPLRMEGEHAARDSAGEEAEEGAWGHDR